MGKHKLRRFAENETFEYLIQTEAAEVLNKKHWLFSKWNNDFFRNKLPIVLELGCGRGEYTLGLARAYPEKNFLGIDIKGARIWRGAKTIDEEIITNAGFLRTRIEFIESFFSKDEIDEIWITFPDPQLKEKRIKKRLTSPGFLNRYQKFLRPDGIIHLKTDSQELFEYTLHIIQKQGHEILENTTDLYSSHSGDKILSIQTHYENFFRNQGKKINYLKFRLRSNEDNSNPK